MPFEKAFTNDYHELPLSTQQRFAEIEINQAIKNLSNIMKQMPDSRQQAQKMMHLSLVPSYHRNPENEERFYKALNTKYFMEPPHKEKIHYMILKGLSYNKIRQVIKVSPNTISQMRVGLPTYYPVLNIWESPATLPLWNDIKHNFNLWNENLLHGGNN